MTVHTVDRYLDPAFTPSDPLLLPAEVADWLRVTTGTLAGWRVAKTGPKPQPVGSRIFYRASDVQAYLDEQRDAS